MTRASGNEQGAMPHANGEPMTYSYDAQTCTMRPVPAPRRPWWRRLFARTPRPRRKRRALTAAQAQQFAAFRSADTGAERL